MHSVTDRQQYDGGEQEFQWISVISFNSTRPTLDILCRETPIYRYMRQEVIDTATRHYSLLCMSLRFIADGNFQSVCSG